MNPVRLFLLTLVLAITGAVLLWKSDQSPVDSDSSVVNSTPSVLPLAAEEIASITIHDPNRAELITRLERSGGKNWIMTEPLKDLADLAAVQSLLSALCRDPSSELPPEWESSTAVELGLSPARITVEVVDHGGVTWELKLGVADISGDYYAASSSGVAFLISKSAYDVIRRPANDWRDPTVIHDSNLIKRVKLTPPGGDPSLEMELRGRTWWLTSPAEYPLSEYGLNMLRRVLRARSYDLREDAATPSQSKLLREQGYRWEFHSKREQQELFYYQRFVLNSLRPYPLPVSPEDFQFHQLSLEDLRSQRLFDLLPDEVRSLKISAGSLETTFRRSRRGWQFSTGHETDKGDGNNLDRLTSMICALETKGLQDRPESPPTGSIVLSRSRQPLANNGLELLWWAGDGSSVLVASVDSDSAVPINRQMHRLAVSLAGH